MSKIVKFPVNEPKTVGAKRIYVYPEFTHSVTESCPTDVGYVREDIVDELVEALKELIKFCAPSKDWDDQEIIKARAALAKLEMTDGT